MVPVQTSRSAERNWFSITFMAGLTAALSKITTDEPTSAYA